MKSVLAKGGLSKSCCSRNLKLIACKEEVCFKKVSYIGDLFFRVDQERFRYVSILCHVPIFFFLQTSFNSYKIAGDVLHFFKFLFDQNPTNSEKISAQIAFDVLRKCVCNYFSVLI